MEGMFRGFEVMDTVHGHVVTSSRRRCIARRDKTTEGKQDPTRGTFGIQFYMILQYSHSGLVEKYILKQEYHQTT